MVMVSIPIDIETDGKLPSGVALRLALAENFITHPAIDSSDPYEVLKYMDSVEKIS